MHSLSSLFFVNAYNDTFVQLLLVVDLSIKVNLEVKGGIHPI